MQRPLQIKDALHLDNKKSYGFVNCYVHEDSELFIDYNLLKQNIVIHNFDRKTACKKIIDFFKTNLDIIRTDPDKVSENMLIHEINDTHFGSTTRGNNSRGKGPSKDELKDFFRKITENNLDKTVINEPMDLLIFAKGLGPDSFSDLITKIIAKELYEFSIKVFKQSNKLDEVKQKGEQEIEFWDNKNHKMSTIIVPKLSIKNSNIILVPYRITTKRIKYNANDFLNSVINSVKRTNELAKKGRKKAMTKKEIVHYETKKYGTSERKTIVFNEVLKERHFLKSYHDKFNSSKFLMNNVHPLLNDNDIYK